MSLLLVACSRTLTPADLDAALAASGWEPGVVVPLSAVAEGWAEARGYPVLPMRPDIRRHGTAAWYLRNERAGRLASEGEGRVLAAWNGIEVDSVRVLVVAMRWGLEQFVHEVRAEPRCCKNCGEPVERAAREKAEVVTEDQP
jgi:hypothetical protein